MFLLNWLLDWKNQFPILHGSLRWSAPSRPWRRLPALKTPRSGRGHASLARQSRLVWSETYRQVSEGTRSYRGRGRHSSTALTVRLIVLLAAARIAPSEVPCLARLSSIADTAEVDRVGAPLRRRLGQVRSSVETFRERVRNAARLLSSRGAAQEIAAAWMLRVETDDGSGARCDRTPR